jgi:hypothetical protein
MMTSKNRPEFAENAIALVVWSWISVDGHCDSWNRHWAGRTDLLDVWSVSRSSVLGWYGLGLRIQRVDVLVGFEIAGRSGLRGTQGMAG